MYEACIKLCLCIDDWWVNMTHFMTLLTYNTIYICMSSSLLIWNECPRSFKKYLASNNKHFCLYYNLNSLISSHFKVCSVQGHNWNYCFFRFAISDSLTYHYICELINGTTMMHHLSFTASVPDYLRAHHSSSGKIELFLSTAALFLPEGNRCQFELFNHLFICISSSR